MKTTLTIIIKCLNEEQNINRAIKSSLKNTIGIKREIIVADSLSTDNTIKIASQFPVSIVQITNEKERSCGVGPQLGYQYAQGEFIYILDADMEFEEDFIKKALNFLYTNKEFAGVAGEIKEMRTKNLIFKRRKQNPKAEYGDVDKLEMGGLYRRSSIEEVGYFSNKNLHSFEEAELGFRLVSKGWKLRRLKIPAIKHYGYTISSLDALKKRWKTNYVMGNGEFLRASIMKPYFLKTINCVKLYFFVFVWWIFFVISIMLSFVFGPLFLKLLMSLSLIFVVLFFIKKRSLKEVLFSFLSWQYQCLGLIIGFIKKQKNPNSWIDSKIIKLK